MTRNDSQLWQETVRVCAVGILCISLHMYDTLIGCGRVETAGNKRGQQWH